MLLRPLGDVVVLMPPLTITSEELHRIVHTLALALDDVRRRAVSTLARVGRRRGRAGARRRAVAGTARPRRRRAPRASSRPTGARSCRSRRTTTSASRSTPRWCAPRTTRSTGGARARARRASSSGRVRCTPSSKRELARLEARPTTRCCSPPVSPPTSACSRTFAGPDVLVCSDELNHASLIDGRRLAQAPLAVYRHGDAAHVDELLRDSGAARAVVVTETVFSMDGDVAPLDDLLDVCARHGALLVIDEAHAVLGPSPDLARAPDVDVLRVGTLSKTMGALGGFVAGPQRYTQLLVNRARSYIFTTASSPADAAAALAALRRRALARGRRRCARACARTSTGSRPVTRRRSSRTSAASEERALDAAAALLDLGLLVTAIRPPTVPAGHVAPAGHGVGRALARAGRHARRRRSARSSPNADDPARHARARHRHGHRGGQDVVDGTSRAEALRAAGVAVAARKPVQSGDGTGARRQHGARGGDRRGRSGGDTAPPHVPRWRGHRRWPPPSSACPRSRWPTSRSEITWPDRHAGRPGRGRRRPALADRVRRRHRRPRARARARRGRAGGRRRPRRRSTRCGSRCPRSRAGRGRRVQPLRARRACRAGTTTSSSTRATTSSRRRTELAQSSGVSRKSSSPSLTYSGKSCVAMRLRDLTRVAEPGAHVGVVVVAGDHHEHDGVVRVTVVALRTSARYSSTSVTSTRR